MKILPFAILLVVAPTLRAADLYWDKTGADWGVAANWSTASNAATPDPAAAPGSADTAIFTTTGAGVPQTVNLLAAQSALGISTNISNAFLTTIVGGGTDQTLNLGTGGINHAGGGLTLGSATAGQQVNIALQGNQTWTSSAAGTNPAAIQVLNGVSAGVAGTTTLLLNGININSTISGVISNGAGTLALEKSGPGTWTLSGANTFSGGVTLTSGALNVNNASALGTGTFTINGGTINNSTGAGITHTGAFNKVLGGSFTFGTTGNSLTLGALATGTPTITLTANIVATVNGTTRLTLVGHTINGGSNTLTKEGAGALTIGGTNTAASGATATLGGTTVNGGTLTFIKSGLTPGDHVLGATAVASGATLILATNNNSTNVNFTTSGLSGSGTITTTNDQTSGTAQRTLRVGNGNATSTFSGTITNTLPTEDGFIALTKIGTGTQVLSGVNTYTGATTVSAGTLQIGLAGVGSLGAASAVTVNAATANLAGTGAINGSTTITNGFLRPGDNSGASVGTITMSQLALNTGGTAILQIEGVGNNDRIDILTPGGLTLDGKINVTTSLSTGSGAFDTAFAIGNSFDLANWTGALTGTFDVGANLRDGSADTGLQLDLPNISSLSRLWDVSNFTTSGVITVVAVPEPGKAMLLFFGLASLGLLSSRYRIRR